MGQKTNQQSLRLPAPLRLFAILTVLLTLLSWAVAFFWWRRGMPYPYSWPYYGHSFGTDFSNFQQRFQYFHSDKFFQFKGPVFLYAAPLAAFYHILFVAWGNRSNALPAFEIFGLCVVGAAVLLFYRALRRHGVPANDAALFCFVSGLFSYPLYFDLERGNVEIIVWTFTLIAFWAFRNDRMALAAIFIGFAIAFKWYPVVLLGVFFYPRKYGYIAVALVTAVGVTVLSDLWLGPTITTAFHETLRGAQVFVQLYAVHYSDLGYDHSFFSVFKFLTYPLHPNLAADLNLYLVLAAVSATALYFLRIRKLPLINQISILIILSVTLPPVSFDYTLLHLYICWGIFVIYLIDAQRAGHSVKFGSLVMGLYAFAMAPHGYVILASRRFCGQLRWIGLAALLYIFFKQPFPEEQTAAPLSASEFQLSPTLEGSNS
ncbi:MAG: hypothetical protein JWQ49_4528 [Edaphobacter sp.]|nr:hypothetical protein [Edaphobacter sp.]